MISPKNSHAHSYTALMRYARMLRFGDIYTKIDSATGLHAMIAVHNTTLGAAIGGCRFYPYASPEAALQDVLRLSYGMTLKAAACGLPHGGAKAVIITPRGNYDRASIFRAFGDFIQELKGRYITAIDVGTSMEDMTTILERTPYVIGAEGPGRVDQDPSSSTAKGVFRAMQAAIKFKWKRDDCNDIRVAIQGVGHVGYTLAKHLTEHGAKVIVSDTNEQKLARCKQEFGTEIVAPHEIEKVACDIFSPCALGGTITHHLVQETQASIIAGSANNQLAHHNNTQLMQERGIIYLPDFLINSGGLINAAMTYAYQNVSMADKKIDEIYTVVQTLLERAAHSQKTTTTVAEEMAFERLKCSPN